MAASPGRVRRFVFHALRPHFPCLVMSLSSSAYHILDAGLHLCNCGQIVTHCLLSSETCHDVVAPSQQQIDRQKLQPVQRFPVKGTVSARFEDVAITQQACSLAELCTKKFGAVQLACIESAPFEAMMKHERESSGLSDCEMLGHTQLKAVEASAAATSHSRVRILSSTSYQCLYQQARKEQRCLSEEAKTKMRHNGSYV